MAQVKRAKVSTDNSPNPSLLTLTIIMFATYGAFHVYKLTNMLGFSKDIHNCRHVPQKCRPVPPIECGAEDFAITSNGLVFISSGLKTFAACDPNKLVGKIYTFNFTSHDRSAKELRLKGGLDFASFTPHGISLWEDPVTGEVLLYVINHARHDIDTVEVFKYAEENRTLHHMRTITDKTLSNLNDLIVVGQDEFYATNDRYFRYSWQYMMEMIFMLPWGSLTYYKHGQSKIVSDSLFFPNGVAVSPDSKYIYAMETLKERIVVYRRTKDAKLSKERSITINTIGDNLQVDSHTGDIYTGSAGVFYKLLMKKTSGPYMSPTLVTRIKMPRELAPNSTTSLTELYSNDGSEISGGSVAAHWRGKLLIGSVFHKLLLCDVNTTEQG